MSRLTPGTLVGLALVAATLAALVVLELRVLPAFVDMYRDFGGRLPGLTRLVVSRAWFLATTVAVLSLGGVALVPRAPRARALGLLLAIFLGVAGILTTLAGAYYPIFERAGNLKP